MVNRMTIDLRLAGRRDLAASITPPPGIPLQHIKAKRFSTSESTTPIVSDLSANSSNGNSTVSAPDEDICPTASVV